MGKFLEGKYGTDGLPWLVPNLNEEEQRVTAVDCGVHHIAIVAGNTFG